MADAIGLTKPEGALVADVTKDSPAANADIKQGDIITAVGSKAVSTPKVLSRLIADLSPGDTAAVTVWRDGKSVDLKVGVGGSAGGMKELASTEGDRAPAGPRIGISLADITPDVRGQMGLSDDVKGAIVAGVSADKPAAEAGVKTGDIILSVSGKAVHNASDAKNAIGALAKSDKKSVLLLVQRGDNKIFVAVPFAAA